MPQPSQFNVKSLQNPSQLLLRNSQRLAATQPLVVHYPADDLLSHLARQRPELHLTAFGDDFAAYRQRQRTGELPAERLHFAPTYQPTRCRHDGAILFLPKSRPLLEMTLAMVAAALEPGAPFWLVGENQAGIRAAQAVLERQIGPVRLLDQGRHCQLFEATLQTQPPPFQLDAWVNRYEVTLEGEPLTVISLPGVFSYGRLDEGTRLLLATLTNPPQGRVLDFGCGAGVIGALVKRRWPELAVELADVSALALEATRQTFAANRLAAASLQPTHLFADLPGGYGTILSNPPFHTGVASDQRLLRAFVTGARQQLQPGGVLQFVTQRAIKIQPLVEAEIGACALVAQNRQYTVYRAICSTTWSPRNSIS